MHISEIKVKNFGAIKEKSIRLTDGLVIVRGPNEQGKSTLFTNAPLYAFFGSSAVDGTTVEFVREGKSPSSMFVELTYGPYTVRRSPVSAVVKGPDNLKITGQTEVTNFFVELFGVQAKTIKHVTVAEQGDMSGLFKKLPSEVTAFIEKLAGFHQIDEILEAAQSKFLTGAKSHLEESIEEIKATLSTLKDAVLPDVQTTEKEEAAANKAHSGLLAVKKEVEDRLAELERIYKESAEKNREIEVLEGVLQHLQDTNLQLTTSLAVLMKSPPPPLDEATYTSAVDYIENVIPTIKQKIEVQEWVKKANAWQTKNFWEGNIKSFTTALSDLSNKKAEAEKRAAEIGWELRAKKKEIILEPICSKCGSEVKDADTINAKLNSEMAALRKELAAITTQLEEVVPELKILIEISDNHNLLEKVRPEKVDVESYEFVPHLYKTTFEPVELDADETERCERVVKEFLKLQAQHTGHAVKERELVQSVGRCRADLDLKTKALKKRGSKINLELISAKMIEEKAEVKQLQDNLDISTKNLTEINSRLAVEKLIVERHHKDIADAKDALAAAEESLKTELRNIKLLRGMREAKPKVMNMIWGKVLLSLQTNFSMMRGKESTVVKSPEGFLIDGLHARRQSGSTRSILGVALRDSLRDIFAPNCGFIIFDEVFADMDSDRAATTLAAISLMSGQKIIITHDSVSEMAADQFINL